MTDIHAHTNDHFPGRPGLASSPDITWQLERKMLTLKNPLIFTCYFSVCCYILPSVVDNMLEGEDQRSIDKAVAAIQAECKKRLLT